MKNRATLILIMAISLLGAACGKKKNNTAPAPVVSPYGYNGTYPYNNAPYYGYGQTLTYQSFVSAVAANQFPGANMVATFHYFQGNINVDVSKCLWIFTCTTFSANSSTFTRISDPMLGNSHGLCNGQSGQPGCTSQLVLNGLMQIISTATFSQQVSASAYGFTDAVGKTRIIDLNMPLLAQPVKQLDQMTGVVYQLQY